MLNIHAQLAANERRLLEQAEQFARDKQFADVTAGEMQELTRDRGVDFATAVLYCLCDHTRPGSLPAESSHATDATASLDLQIAIVPGAFYLEHPHTGADGGRLRRAATAVDLDCRLIPVENIGLLETNARIIVDWLLEHATRPTVLVTLCKGGADLKTALRHPLAEQAFAKVRAWYSLCGILGGSPMVDWICQRPLSTLAARLLFWLRRRDFQFVSDLRTGPRGPLGLPLQCPRPLDIYHVVGFPLTAHLSNARSRTWHRRLAQFGPSDGATLLLDVCQQPGRVLPVWGVDHYAAARVDWDALVRDILLRQGTTPGKASSSNGASPSHLTASTPV